jgi:hypothetical protein
VEVYRYTSLTSAQYRYEWSNLHSGRSAPGTRWVGGQVEIRASLGALENRKPLAPAENETQNPLLYSPYCHETN